MSGSVVVALFADIEAGQVVATLDDEALRASIETARSVGSMLSLTGVDFQDASSTPSSRLVSWLA